MSKKIRTLANDSRNEINYSKITDKYWSVYYYLVSISLWDMTSKEDHRYVDKKNINISNVSKMLNISRPTFYKAIERLQEYSLIYTLGKEDHYYYIPSPPIYAETNIKTIDYLLHFRKYVGIDLLRTYLILSKYFKLHKQDGKEKFFVRKEIVDLLGHNIRDTSYYGYIDIYLSLLQGWGLIELKSQTITTANGGYVKYTLVNVLPDSVYTLQEFYNEVDELNAVGISKDDYKILKSIKS